MVAGSLLSRGLDDRGLYGVIILAIVNPCEIFAQMLSMGITAPRLHNLNGCMSGVPQVCLGSPMTLPTENWIIRGYGRMGIWTYRRFVENAIRPVIIDCRMVEISVSALSIAKHLVKGGLFRMAL